MYMMHLLRSYRAKILYARAMSFINRMSGRSSGSSETLSSQPSLQGISCKRIAFIDHSLHQKTGSSDFLIRLLNQKHQIDLYQDPSWKGGPAVNWKGLDANSTDVVILFQTFYYHPPHKLEQLNCQNIVLVPMYDDTHNFPDKVWKNYHRFRFINFSEHLHSKLVSLGLTSLHLHYFPDPGLLPAGKNDFAELHGFFWQRTNDITWDHIRQLIRGTPFKKFHIHLALDAKWYKEVLPTRQEMEKYNITLTHWFDRRDAYLEAVNRANVFFAPRLFEGIGMPFLEAMAMGKVVVAAGQPTMNEYIRHGETGIFYDIRKIVPVDLSDAARLSGNAEEHCRDGFGQWKNQKEDLLQWIIDPNL
ncbi:MAG TPA: glycosyltransferase [Bacteroidales bacterium]|nr:glycosyltransferase [Bacteroidales bacterium]